MATTIELNLKAATTDLLDYDESNLIEQLGMRAKSFEVDFSGMEQPAMKPTYDAKVLGPMDEIRKLGLRIAKRWIKELRDIACGAEADDKEDRNKLQSAFGLTGSDLAAALAGFLVACFGTAAAIATVVAAIIVKRLGGSAMDEFCKTSAEWLE
jgi:hypothetical protein